MEESLHLTNKNERWFAHKQTSSHANSTKVHRNTSQVSGHKLYFWREDFVWHKLTLFHLMIIVFWISLFFPLFACCWLCLVFFLLLFIQVRSDTEQLESENKCVLVLIFSTKWIITRPASLSAESQYLCGQSKIWIVGFVAMLLSSSVITTNVHQIVMCCGSDSWYF